MPCRSDHLRPHFQFGVAKDPRNSTRTRRRSKTQVAADYTLDGIAVTDGFAQGVMHWKPPKTYSFPSKSITAEPTCRNRFATHAMDSKEKRCLLNVVAGNFRNMQSKIVRC